MTFIEAIAREEGFGIDDSRAHRNNNPGNLDFEPWQEKYGAVLETIPEGIHETPRFAKFPDAVKGFAAMRELLVKDYLGKTIVDALNEWAPPSDGNDTSSYTAHVTEWMGVGPDTELTEELIGA